MNSVTSADGTAIACDRLGDGPPVIVVGGLLCDRAKTRPLAEELAKQFTVFNYDRRGRGDSGDSAPYAVGREVEDLAAVIAAAGGMAAVYGHSSGAGLALHAAAQGLPITRVVLHEPPYNPDEEDARRVSRAFAATLEPVLAEGRRGAAVELVATSIMGMPPETIEQVRGEPWWAEMEAMAPTIAYDSEVMGDKQGGAIPVGLLGAVSIPALVLCGGASPDWAIDVCRQIANEVPNGRFEVLEGQEHVVPPEVLVPVLAEFFAGR